MVDIHFIRENKDQIKQAAQNKGIELDVEKLLELDVKRVELLQQIENLNAEKNKINDEIKTATERDALIARGREVKEKLDAIGPEYDAIKKEFDLLMVKVPTVPSPDTPVGKSDAENVEIKTWGDKPFFDFTPKDHIQIGKDLDILDLEKGARVGGYRGYYIKNEGVLLVMAIMMYSLQKMIEAGYRPMIPPTLVKQFALFGSGYFKGLEYDPDTDEIYQVATSDKDVTGQESKDKKFLVGTAEPSLLAYYSGDTLNVKDLPVKLCGFSQCYRSEIGSYGKDTKGLYRVHEFMKVEQVVITPADVDAANKLQEEMCGLSQSLHEGLGLPYRVLQICTGDMSAGKYRAFDIEAWMAGLGRWGETGSASNFLDWQSRRLDVKYTDADGKKKHVYMLNNTAMASVRPFIAILENYQQKDGSVLVPKELQKFAGFSVIGPR